MVTPFALQRAYGFNPYRNAHLYLFDKPEVGAHLAPPMGELSAQPTERALSAPYGGTSPIGRGKSGFAASPSTSNLQVCLVPYYFIYKNGHMNPPPFGRAYFFSFDFHCTKTGSLDIIQAILELGGVLLCRSQLWSFLPPAWAAASAG